MDLNEEPLTEKQLADLRRLVFELLAEIDQLDGVAQLPYRNAIRLSTAVDAVRVELGEPSRIAE